jgi:hypothetical protein
MNIMDHLVGLNQFLVYVIILVACLLLVLLCSLATSRLVDNKTRRGHNEIAGYILTTVGAIYGVFLAFLTIIVWQNYDDAASNAAREASVALALYRNVDLYPDQEQVRKVTDGLLAYVRSVITDEFPAMARMTRSPVTDQVAGQLWAGIRTISPRNLQEQMIFQEILQYHNKLATLRVERLMQANNPKLSGFMRNTLIMGAIITLLSALLFGAESFWWHLTLTSLLAILLATIFLVLFELGHPYASRIRITPGDYVEVLNIIEGLKK